MIGHEVQQVAHAPLVQGAPQMRQLLVASEMRVNVLVVGHIVPVVRERREHGVEVEGVHAEVL